MTFQTLSQSLIPTLVDRGLFYFNGLIVVIFIYHTLRPLYCLSGLTAWTAGILLLVGYIAQHQAGTHGALTSDPYALRIG